MLGVCVSAVSGQNLLNLHRDGFRQSVVGVYDTGFRDKTKVCLSIRWWKVNLFMALKPASHILDIHAEEHQTALCRINLA